MIQITTTGVAKKGSFWLSQQHKLQLMLVAALCSLALLFSALADRTVIQSVFLTMDVPATELDPAENEELLQHFGSIKGQRFWQIDVHAVRDQLKSLNWIDDIYVRKHWPDGIELKLGVALPVAIWGDGGFLTAQGNVIKAARSKTGLPQVYAPPFSAKAAAQLLASACEHLGPITALSIDVHGEAAVTLPTGLKINLGASQFALHLERAKQIINKKNAKGRRLASIDLRYSRGAAVSWLGY